MEDNTIKIKVIDRDKVQHELISPTDMGMNLMEVLKSYELPVEGICGGMALCASCHCYVHNNPGSTVTNDEEQAMLDETENIKENSRLACQIKVTEDLDGLIIELAPEMASDTYSDW